MSSQIHGVVWEDVVKATSFFSGASNQDRINTSVFDIEARFDKRNALPTSVKSTKTNTICLADARRFIAIDCDYRMVVGAYTQDGSIKSFGLVHEFIITKSVHAKIVGALTPLFVECFHNIISIKSIESFEQARKVASLINQASFGSLLTLNPKIDSKTQRRLQCSLNIEALKEHCAHTEFKDEYAEIILPFRIKSPSRNEG